MMTLPSLFGENLLDDFFGFDYPIRRAPKAPQHEMMKTDVRELDHSFELDVSVPGFSKEDLKIELKDGYMTISGSTSSEKEEKDDANGRYIRRERFQGSCSRSFYVGEELTEEDIKARYENGILKLSVPKAEEKPKVEQKRFVTIEG